MWNKYCIIWTESRVQMLHQWRPESHALNHRAHWHYTSEDSHALNHCSLSDLAPVMPWKPWSSVNLLYDRFMLHQWSSVDYWSFGPLLLLWILCWNEHCDYPPSGWYYILLSHVEDHKHCSSNRLQLCFKYMLVLSCAVKKYKWFHECHLLEKVINAWVLIIKGSEHA